MPQSTQNAGRAGLRYGLALLAAAAAVSALAGCGRIRLKKEIPLSEVHRKFRQACAEEGLDVVVKPLAGTVYIYVPLKSPLLGYEASYQRHPPSSDANERPSLNYINARYDEASDSFVIAYDITTSRIYSDDPGYQSKMEDTYTKAYTKIYGAILASYLNTESPDGTGAGAGDDTGNGAASAAGDETADDDNGGFRAFRQDYKNDLTAEPAERIGVKNGEDTAAESLPEFYVVIFADTVNGVGIKTTFTLQDYKRYILRDIPQEEYANRTLSEIYGDKDMIGDTEGRHLELTEVRWRWFMAQLIKTRIENKYKKSMFPPSPDSVKEIKFLTAETLQYYGYKKYSEVVLDDILNDSNVEFSREDIEAVDIDKTGTRTIKFDINKHMK